MFPVSVIITIIIISVVIAPIILVPSRITAIISSVVIATIFPFYTIGTSFTPLIPAALFTFGTIGFTQALFTKTFFATTLNLIPS